MTRTRTLAACAVFLGLSIPARAQVAYEPSLGSFPSGVGLSVTPVVSADRRYVRMTLNAQFTAIEGFTNILIPGAAVSGGGRGGMRNVTVAAGMDGVTTPGETYFDGPAMPGGFASASESYWPEPRPRVPSSRRTTRAKAKRPAAAGRR